MSTSDEPSPLLRIALCQINATVGDIAGNAQRVIDGIAAARAAGAQLVLAPELAITGYPPEDLLLKPHFLRQARAALEQIAAATQDLVAIVGVPELVQDVFNCAAVLSGGAVRGFYRKQLLPNYGVFDEQRYFQVGTSAAVIDIDGHRVGITVCEDMWEPGPPASDEALAGATLLVNISASPYHAGKGVERERMFAARARDNIACVAFCALVGGQDELIFDGHSFVVDHSGELVARAAQFREALLVCDVDLATPAAVRLRDSGHRPTARRGGGDVRVLARVELPEVGPRIAAAPALAPLLEPLEAEVYEALLLGLRDYVYKNGFSHVVLGLSGGIDSALVACLAVDALGAERVGTVVMPSPYSSPDTQRDAHTLAARLGARSAEL